MLLMTGGLTLDEYHHIDTIIITHLLLELQGLTQHVLLDPSSEFALLETQVKLKKGRIEKMKEGGNEEDQI